MPLTKRIEKHKATLAQLGQNTVEYLHLSNYIKGLEAALPKPQITLHKAPESTCESCE